MKYMEENKKEVILTRTYDAPRASVFTAWTDPKMVAQWWGPNGVTNPTCVWEARPGGAIKIVMLAGADLGPMAGQEWPMTGTFEEVEEPSKLVYTANAIIAGKEVLQTLTTVTFAENDGKTDMTVHIVVTKTTPEAAGPLQGMEMGWNQQLDKLGNFLKK